MLASSDATTSGALPSRTFTLGHVAAGIDIQLWLNIMHVLMGTGLDLRRLGSQILLGRDWSNMPGWFCSWMWEHTLVRIQRTPIEGAHYVFARGPNLIGYDTSRRKDRVVKDGSPQGHPFNPLCLIIGVCTCTSDDAVTRGRSCSYHALDLCVALWPEPNQVLQQPFALPLLLLLTAMLGAQDMKEENSTNTGMEVEENIATGQCACSYLNTYMN